MQANIGSAIVSDYLQASLMLLGPIRDPERETALTARRRQALFEPASASLLAHLAVQGFLNEFCWHANAEEDQRIAELAESGKTDPGTLLRLACYRPLLEVRNAGDLPRHHDALRAVLSTHVDDVLEERRIRDELEALTPIREGLSQAVREMYEANPYPRWVVMAETLVKPPVALPTGADVLVAGCGTGRHAIQTARRDPTSRVLAVDLSKASLAYASRMARAAGVDNISFAHADLLELPALGRTFDIVECVGTLPCMDDPAEGLAALNAMLRPGGHMLLGLYSAIARKPLVPAQRLGATWDTSPQGIRSYRRRIMTAPPGDPLRAAMDFGDFYSASTTRDLLLHIKEHVHTLPEIAALLDGAGLAYQALTAPAGHPPQPSLAAWDAYEQAHPATFRRMYHVWSRKA